MILWNKRNKMIFTLAGLLLASGCAKQADFEALQRQVYYLNEELSRVESGVSATTSRVSELATDQERLRPTIQRSQMDVSFRLEEVEREIAALRNQLEMSARQQESGRRTLDEKLDTYIQRNNSEMATLVEKQDVQAKRIDDQESSRQQQLSQLSQRLATIEQSLGEVRAESSATAASLQALTESSKQPAGASTAAPSGVALAKQDGESNYDYIRRLFREEKFTQARSEYPTILAGAQNDGERAGIMYWYGSAVQRLGDERQAILIFEEQAKKYPNHWSTAFAILKQGHAFRALGDQATARLFYQRVLSEFPNSDAANYARRALE